MGFSHCQRLCGAWRTTPTSSPLDWACDVDIELFPLHALQNFFLTLRNKNRAATFVPRMRWAFLTATFAFLWATPPEVSADCVCFEPEAEASTRESSSLVLWSGTRHSVSPSNQFYSQHYSQSVQGAASVGGVPLLPSQAVHWSSLDNLMTDVPSLPRELLVNTISPLLESRDPSVSAADERAPTGGFVLVCIADSSLCVPLPPAPTIKDTIATGAGAGATRHEPELTHDSVHEFSLQQTHSRTVATRGPAGVSSRLFRPPLKRR